jgi:MoxR-like ATPase
MKTPSVICRKAKDYLDIPNSPFVDVHGHLVSTLLLTACGNKLYETLPNILLNSPHGLGKSLLAVTFRARLSEQVGLDIPMITVDCSQDTREQHLKGNLVGMGDETPFVLGPATDAINLANDMGCCILNLEEISALTPGSQKMLNSILDWRRSLEIPQLAKKFSLTGGARVLVWASMNPSAYGGVYTLNDDLRSRFREFRVPFPNQEQELEILKAVCPYADEALLENLTTLASQTRGDSLEYHFGTRDLVKFLEDVQRTQLIDLAAEINLLNKFDGSERDTMADRIDASLSTSLKARVAKEVRGV